MTLPKPLRPQRRWLDLGRIGGVVAARHSNGDRGQESRDGEVAGGWPRERRERRADR